MPWRENPGKQPRGTAGKRVHVRLRCGSEPPESWAADGRYGCNWALEGSDWDITHWRLA